MPEPLRNASLWQDPTHKHQWPGSTAMVSLHHMLSITPSPAESPARAAGDATTAGEASTQSSSRTRHRRTSGELPTPAGVFGAADALQLLTVPAAGAATAAVACCALLRAACWDDGPHPPVLLPLPPPCGQSSLQGCHSSCTASPCSSSHASAEVAPVPRPAKNGAAAAAVQRAASSAGICRGGSDAGQWLPASDGAAHCWRASPPHWPTARFEPQRLQEDPCRMTGCTRL